MKKTIEKFQSSLLADAPRLKALRPARRRREVVKRLERFNAVMRAELATAPPEVYERLELPLRINEAIVEAMKANDELALQALDLIARAGGGKNFLAAVNLQPPANRPGGSGH